MHIQFFTFQQDYYVNNKSKNYLKTKYLIINKKYGDWTVLSYEGKALVWY